MLNMAVFISGNGSNLQSIIDNVHKTNIKGTIKFILSNNSNAFGLVRGKRNNIKTYVTRDDETIINLLKEHKVDLIVLAGYLKILSKNIVKEYKEQIINIHPSLIPKYCGKGFFGNRVHEIVLQNKEAYTGVTIHFVDEGIDTGNIIKQKKVMVLKEDTVEKLKNRVLKTEHEILVEVITDICKKYNS